ncbi:MAG TPA: helix-turn-helix transcriptional regulator [Solirubrobacteraceae bacterium]|nr:helix-turn-helix transcriptional regulator [Solirubrobacteraceae bacterium]
MEGVDQLLELIGDTCGLLEIGEFRLGVQHAVRRAVPADWIGVDDIGPDPETTTVNIDPPAPPALVEKFKLYAHQNPLIVRHQRTHDGRALRFSDVVSAAELHALPLYREFYAPMGIEHMVAFTLSHAPDRILGVALGRAGNDFTDDERDLLNQARPFLIQAYRNAIRYTNVLGVKARPDAANAAPELEPLIALGLTRRQAQVLQLTAIGASERDIAAHLELSPRTVEKHLERCYRALGVHDRARASELAWATTDVPAEPRRIHRASG